MNVTKPCPICINETNCECANLTLSFFRILEGTHNRVLSEKPASPPTPHLYVLGAGVDKLNGVIQGGYSIGELLQRLATSRIPVTRKILKNRAIYYEIGYGTRVVHLKINDHNRTVTELISNPNRFDFWGEYMKMISIAIPEPTLKNLVITRLDLNLDFEVEFATLIQEIDLKLKQSSIQYEDDGGRRTGINIGKKPESIVIYDKAHKENLIHPRTRIELRLTGDRLPTRNLFDIEDSVRSPKIFNGIVGLRIIDTPSLRTNSKLQPFLAILTRDGYFAARKAFNLNRNFHRDIESLISPQLWDLQPNQLFQEHIKTFFNNEGDTTCNQKTNVLTLVR